MQQNALKRVLSQIKNSLQVSRFHAAEGPKVVVRSPFEQEMIEHLSLIATKEHTSFRYPLLSTLPSSTRLVMDEPRLLKPMEDCVQLGSRHEPVTKMRVSIISAQNIHEIYFPPNQLASSNDLKMSEHSENQMPIDLYIRPPKAEALIQLAGAHNLSATREPNKT